MPFYIGCDTTVERRNITFHYPSGRLQRDPKEIADNLQAAFDVLALQFPAPDGMVYGRHFTRNNSIKIGYRRGRQNIDDGLPIDDNEPGDHDLVAGYYDQEQRINVPWDFLQKRDSSHGFDVGVQFQPEYCCGHELCHPFEATYLKGNQNQHEWKEGVCDFGRLLLLKAWSRRHETFGAVADQYKRYISTLDPTPFCKDAVERKYHYAAQLILAWFTRGGRELCFSQLRQLFDGYMTTLLGTWQA
jgi:hypothetical protein